MKKNKPVKPNGLTYRALKRAIARDIRENEVDYEYRHEMIEVFRGVRITYEEADECEALILPYKPY